MQSRNRETPQALPHDNPANRNERRRRGFWVDAPFLESGRLKPLITADNRVSCRPFAALSARRARRIQQGL
jgi:hypothetical protein